MIEVPAEGSGILNVWRSEFDHWLVQQSGADILDEHEMIDFEGTGDKVDIRVRRTKEAPFLIEASYLIGADGANGVVGREALKIAYKHSHLSITAEIPASPAEIERLRGRCLVDFGSVPYGYAWIFPKRETFSVGIAGYS